MNEPPFRSIAIGLVLVALAISTYHRAMAERLASPLSERLALLLSSWLVALAGLVTLGFIQPQIRREEAHLAARFGGAYEEYRRRSGSLLPRLRR